MSDKQNKPEEPPAVEESDQKIKAVDLFLAQYIKPGETTPSPPSPEAEARYIDGIPRDGECCEDHRATEDEEDADSIIYL